MQSGKIAVSVFFVCLLTAVSRAQLEVVGNPSITNSLPAVMGFVDISTTGGTALNNVADDSEHNIVTTIGNTLFPAGNVRIGNNGVAVAGVTSGDVSFETATIPGSGPVAGVPAGGTGYVFPFWDDLLPTTGASGNAIYWQELGGVLYIMWKNESLFDFFNDSQAVAFEVQVFSNPSSCGASIQYLYPDSVFGGSGASHDDGAHATVGWAGGGTFTPTNAQWSRNTASVSTGTVLSVRFAAYDLAASSPFGPGSLRLQYAGSTCFSTSPSYLLALTLHQGAWPNGWLFGVDIPFSELSAELSSGAPFTGSTTSFDLGPYTGLPTGLSIYAVVLTFNSQGTLNGHSNSISYAIP